MIGLFYEKGWAGEDLILRIGEVEEIRDQLADVNDWYCLVRSGQSLAPKKDLPKLKKLASFLKTCENRNELERFKVKISTGELGCVMCAETTGDLEKMRDVVLSKENESYHQKLNMLFDRLLDYLKSGDSDSVFHNKLARRQYIRTGIACDDYPD